MSIPSESLTILQSEFEYAKETSLQAQQDRLTMVNFFLGLYAAVITASFSIQVEAFRQIVPALLLILALIGFIFIVTLVRLRQSWVSSIKAMTRIKAHFTRHDPELERAFEWTVKSIPKPAKFKTISYLSAIIVAILSSTAVFASFLIIFNSFLFALLITLLFLVLSIATYQFMLQYEL